MPRRAIVLALLGLAGCTGAVPGETPLDDASVTPVRRAVQIAAGTRHACATMSDGSVFCWGNNSSLQLGDGSTRYRGSPKRVRHVSDVAEVATGAGHTCVRTSNGTVSCWGDNLHGQLGDWNEANDGWTASRVAGIEGARQLAAGAGTTCALLEGGALTCWGIGPLGNGSSEPSAKPANPGLSDVAWLAGGSVSFCAGSGNGTAYCWGSDMNGTLDLGGSMISLVPIHVPFADHGRVALGDEHACVLGENAGVACVGNNDSGQLGDGTLEDHSAPVAVTGIESIQGLSLSQSLSCAWDAGGGAFCWGSDAEEAVGNAEHQDRSVPFAVPLNDIVQVVTGGWFTCALRGDGDVFCWGLDAIGDGTVSRPAPVPTRVAFDCEDMDSDGICPRITCHQTEPFDYDWCYRAVFSEGDSCRCATQADCGKLKDEYWVKEPSCDSEPYAHGT